MRASCIEREQVAWSESKLHSIVPHDERLPALYIQSIMGEFLVLRPFGPSI